MPQNYIKGQDLYTNFSITLSKRVRLVPHDPVQQAQATEAPCPGPGPNQSNRLSPKECTYGGAHQWVAASPFIKLVLFSIYVYR